MNKRIIIPALLFVVLFVFAACDKKPILNPTGNLSVTTTEALVTAGSPTTTVYYVPPSTTSIPTTVPFVLPTKPQGEVDKFQRSVLGFELGKLSPDEFETLAIKKGVELIPAGDTGEFRYDSKAYYGDFYYRTAVAHFYYNSEEVLNLISVVLPDIPTALGIKVGDPWWAVEEVYGKPTRSWGNGIDFCVFEYYNGKSVITFRNGISPEGNEKVNSWSISLKQPYIPDDELLP